MSEQLRFDPEPLGTWTEETVFEVTAERLAQYAEAVNDPIPAHRSGELANPVFAIVPVFESLLEPALGIVPLPLIGRIVHGEQDFRFHRPIVPGDKLTARAQMTGWESLPNGTRACVYLETRDAAGDPVNEQYVTFFVRGHDEGTRVGELAPGHRFDEALRAEAPVAATTQHLDADQTFRYAPAAGDPMPIHTDEEVARDAGLPGIIAHGLCTMAFTGWAALTELADGDVRRLKRLAVRFARPVVPDSDLDTRFWHAGSADGITRYAYETHARGELVIKDGLAEIADPA
ncbi:MULTISPECIES: MaoC/PaaZ C-terminal domain-containing protein [unclassified Streptomyces]|uniref:MaoC/PaaZ C-terminal domain-containing protein n=1 Tax=unclassified Streptomyces TaxID=2593676 RepID=UPI00236500C1|nr:MULTISPECIES: MaoC/PaaZ C-terminal domain-containing protein [unclassified Streptomyces]MDF3147111.1 MaoC/PaaZ C-terminal domain-containing protein [Streptomyces sp. T21Q-yed]WDF36059.1 MaoC/PaaZ C-terminal domain-containing protein [Streptomyces sp. T12]